MLTGMIFKVLVPGLGRTHTERLGDFGAAELRAYPETAFSQFGHAIVQLDRPCSMIEGPRQKRQEQCAESDTDEEYA